MNKRFSEFKMLERQIKISCTRWLKMDKRRAISELDEGWHSGK